MHGRDHELVTFPGSVTQPEGHVSKESVMPPDIREIFERFQLDAVEWARTVEGMTWEDFADVCNALRRLSDDEKLKKEMRETMEQRDAELSELLNRASERVYEATRRFGTPIRPGLSKSEDRSVEDELEVVS